MSKKILEQYLEKRNELSSQIDADSLPLDSLVVYQELNYRIDVLETCKAFCQTAPQTTELKVLGFHYQLAESILRALTTERKFGPKPNEEGQKKREAALAAVERVVQDGRRRFSSFKADTQDQYRKTINAFISAVLPVWVQYRNAYVNV